MSKCDIGQERSISLTNDTKWCKTQSKLNNWTLKIHPGKKNKQIIFTLDMLCDLVKAIFTLVIIFAKNISDSIP